MQCIKDLWAKVKAWFYHSETVFLAWLTSVTGVITGVVGYLDLAPLWTLFQTGTGFNSRQLISMGIGIVGLGVTTYIARVRNTEVVNGKLLPKA